MADRDGRGVSTTAGQCHAATVLQRDSAIEDEKNAAGGKDPILIETIARGHSWFEEIASGRAATVRDIAKREGVDEGNVSRMMSFAFLAPDIVKAIVNGRQPVELIAERLKRSGSLPLPWPGQRRLLGFPARQMVN